ncbi:MAG: transglycosylase domain-containing protein, partial [Bacillota bacterium]|nr:transglycosylase domain-containing protein [Bacillota bacterium]
HDRTLKRKFDELIITIQLERQFTKDEILEMYLNQIHFGKQYYGIASAAKGYFGKSLDELTLGEIAILAGMPKGPNLFLPEPANSSRALGRQQVVLNRLVDLGLVTAVDATEAYDYMSKLLSHQGGEQ